MLFIRKLYQGLLKVETGLLIALVLSLILVAVIQIILRNFFDAGLFWAESYIRISVLWIALLGAMMGSRNHEHLAIDVFIHKFSPENQALIERITHLFSAIVCFILAYHSSLFIYSEYQEGTIAFAAIPNWACESIIPITFFVIAGRYLLSALFNIAHDSP